MTRNVLWIFYKINKRKINKIILKLAKYYTECTRVRKKIIHIFAITYFRFVTLSSTHACLLFILLLHVIAIPDWSLQCKHGRSAVSVHHAETKSTDPISLLGTFIRCGNLSEVVHYRVEVRMSGTLLFLCVGLSQGVTDHGCPQLPIPCSI